MKRITKLYATVEKIIEEVRSQLEIEHICNSEILDGIIDRLKSKLTNFEIIKEEYITLVNNSGVCSEIPTGNVSVKKPYGTIITVTPTGNIFNIPSGGNSTVTAVYNYIGTVDKLVIYLK